MPNPDDLIVDAVTDFIADNRGDRDDARIAATVYRDTSEIFHSIARNETACRAAFPGAIVRPDVRAPAIVVVFPSRAIVAWNKGRFRKKPDHVVIDLSGTVTATLGPGEGGARNATVLKITAGGETTSIAMPQGNSQWSNSARALFVGDGAAPG